MISEEQKYEFCKLKEKIIENKNNKCIYICRNTKKYFIINKNEQCNSDMKLISKSIDSRKPYKTKFYFGFSNLDGASLGIDLKLNK